MKKTPFGVTQEGWETTLYTIGNQKGMSVDIMDYGATIVSILVPDRDGNPCDVVLGHPSVKEYEHNGCYFGATVGPNANRIAGAAITLDGVTYELEKNDGGVNNLHSGVNGVSWKMWNVEACTDSSISMSLDNPDLEQGFPGNMHMVVTFTVTEESELVIEYRANSDKKTTINMTNHSYFNLDGHASGLVYDQLLSISAAKMTPNTDQSYPIGTIVDVEGTPFDFRTAKPIGQDIMADDEQIRRGNGYDHNFVLDKHADGLESAAVAYSPVSGIQMETLTDCPGIQLYTANYVIDEIGKTGAIYQPRHAFCLETQYFPNSINEPGFKASIVDADAPYASTTIYRFSTR